MLHLKRLLRRLEADLRKRAGTVAELAELLQREYRAAREAGRTGESFEIWRDDWQSHFLHKQAEEGAINLTVRNLRA